MTVTLPNQSRFSVFPQCERVLVIGLDGATYDVLAPLAEQGVMPHLARLMRSAALAQLNSTLPFITPVAWTTFQTGCDQQSHGIFDFRYLDHHSGCVRLNDAGRITAPTLFDELARAGHAVASINLPMTYPAPQNVEGIVVGGVDSPSARAALAPYPEFAARLATEGVRYQLNTIWRRKPATLTELSAGVAETIAAFHSRVAAARIADEMVPWRLMVAQFQTLDSFQHRCWHLLGIDEPRASSRWVEEARRALTVLDGCIGELLELADRRKAAVVVVSDHGFGKFREKITVPEVLRRAGLLRRATPVARAVYRASRLTWKLRKWLWRRASGPDSTAPLRRPLTALLPIDWRRSLCFTAHGELGGLIYLNDARRMGRGTVVSERQREQAEADVTAALLAARHPETGEALFDEVYSTRQRYACDPIERMWPDVVAIPAPGFQTRSKFNRHSRLMVADPLLSGTHRREGVLMIQAPQAAAGKSHNAELRDVAPTILGLLGLPPGKQMTGHLKSDMVGLPALRETFTSNARRETMKLQPAGSPSPDSAEQQEIVERRLRELGYLE